MTDVLSQSEIDQLLDAISHPSDTMETKVERKIRIYDFKRPDKFTRENIRVISLIGEQIARELSLSLSKIAKTELRVRVASLDQLLYEEYLYSSPIPTLLFSFENRDNKAKSLSSHSIVEIYPSIASRIFAQGNEVKPLDSNFIGENRETIVNIQEAMLNALCNFEPFRFGMKATGYDLLYIDHEHIPNAPRNEMGVLITFEAHFTALKNDEVKELGIINIFLPEPLLTPYRQNLTRIHWQSLHRNYNKAKKINMKPILKDLNVPITVRLGRNDSYTAESISSITEGSIIPLDKIAGEDVDVYAGNVLIGKGEVIVIDETFGVRMMDIVGA
jgi:flagellar motor switch protein FliM